MSLQQRVNGSPPKTVTWTARTLLDNPLRLLLPGIVGWGQAALRPDSRSGGKIALCFWGSVSQPPLASVTLLCCRQPLNTPKRSCMCFALCAVDDSPDRIPPRFSAEGLCVSLVLGMYTCMSVCPTFMLYRNSLVLMRLMAADSSDIT